MDRGGYYGEYDRCKAEETQGVVQRIGLAVHLDRQLQGIGASVSRDIEPCAAGTCLIQRGTDQSALHAFQQPKQAPDKMEEEGEEEEDEHAVRRHPRHTLKGGGDSKRLAHQIDPTCRGAKCQASAREISQSRLYW